MQDTQIYYNTGGSIGIRLRICLDGASNMKPSVPEACEIEINFISPKIQLIAPEDAGRGIVFDEETVLIISYTQVNICQFNYSIEAHGGSIHCGLA